MIESLLTESLSPNPWNKKRPVSPEFVESIRNTSGPLQNIVARKHDDGYQIIAGERRWIAVRHIGLRYIDANVIEADDTRARELTLIENLNRENLTPMEEAEEVADLLAIYHGDTIEVAARLGRSRTFVRSRAALATLDVKQLDGLDIAVDNIPVACLELLAKLPEDIRTHIVQETPWAIPNFYRLQAAAQGLTRSIEGAPWGADAEPPCRLCHKRTGADTDLFGESSGIDKLDRCLDRECYNRKEREFVDGVHAALLAKHGTVVLVAEDIPEHLFAEAKARRVSNLDTLFRKEYETCKASDTNSIICLRFCGTNVGKHSWCRKVAEDAGSIEKRRLLFMAGKVRERIKTKPLDETVCQTLALYLLTWGCKPADETDDRDFCIMAREATESTRLSVLATVGQEPLDVAASERTLHRLLETVDGEEAGSVLEHIRITAAEEIK